MPKRLRCFLADRPEAVAALTKIFLAEIERLLIAWADVTIDAAAPAATRPRIGGISFLYRFGSALNHHVHLHVCVTDGVFVPATAAPTFDAPPAFIYARPITQVHLNHKLRPAVTALAIGNVGKRREVVLTSYDGRSAIEAT